MKEINIEKLYNEVRQELKNNPIEFPNAVSLCKTIEHLHKLNIINLWIMDEQDIKLLIKRIVWER